eukprot:CCRYP_008783-RA/>CCRYP_008783-RA protein AED:0.11 eAED:0.11 QI:0/0.5/0.66/1/0/0/3/1120/271
MVRKSISATDQTCLHIEKLEADREERRRRQEEMQIERAAEEKHNVAQGNPGDVNFIGLVQQWREEHSGLARSHTEGSGGLSEDKICVCVQKRPLNEKERKKRDHNAVTCLHHTATVHSAKLRVDWISKYLDHNWFCFDHAFDEETTTKEVYHCTAKPLVDWVCGGRGARATVFAYDDIFETLSNNTLLGDEGCSLEYATCSITIFEIYGGRIQDLLNNSNRLKVLEDGKGEAIISGLQKFEATNPKEFLAMIKKGHTNCTTHATEANDISS